MDCFYCEKNKQLEDLMIPVCKLSVSDVYLIRNQNFPGRCVVSFKDHKTEMFQLTDEELCNFSRDVAAVAKAVDKLYTPDKINYGVFGDGVPHLHCHVVPKKKGEFCWGGVFDMNGNPDVRPQEELEETAKKIATCIAEVK